MISKAALELMMGRINYCIIDSKYCWAGDVRTAMCLRGVGVEPTNIEGFNSVHIGNLFHWRDPCKKPVTFHHLLTPQMQALFDFEQELKFKGKNNPNYELFAQKYLSNNIEVNATRQGTVLGIKSTTSVQRCQQFCKSIPKCLGFVFEPPPNPVGGQISAELLGKCVLHADIAPIQEKKFYQTGVFPSRFKCQSNTEL
jgi:hypothetical protein